MASRKAPRRRGAGTGYTVLVVDDDPRIVELLQIALGAHGYKVISAGNGEEALRLSFSEQPDILILDVRLPRRSGYEVCRAIRREPELAHLPVIMVSALSDTEARLQGLERGADDYLTKPFSPKELLAKVKRNLERTEKVKSMDRRSRELSGELERSRDELRRIHSDLKRERKVRDAYDRLARDLARLDRPEEVASTFLFSLMTHLSAQSAVLLEANQEEESNLRPMISRGFNDERGERVTIKADGEIAKLLIALARPVRTEELDRFPEMKTELGRLVSCGIAVVVPVLNEGRLIAVGLLGEKSEPAAYTSADIEMATSLSHAAALALEQTALMRHAQSTYDQAISAYLAAVEARDPQTAWKAEAMASVCEALANEIGSGPSTANHLRLEATATVLDAETATSQTDTPRLRAFSFLREPSSIESEILAIGQAYVELIGRLELGASTSQIIAHLKGDRQVLKALENLLNRGELTPNKLLGKGETSSDTSAA